jgi:sugar phosphate isomerase/epimerase
MKHTGSLSRRRFLQNGLLGSTALAAAALPTASLAAVTKTDRDPVHGLKLGLTSYSLRQFTFDQAIAMTRQLGVKYISLKDMHLPYKTTTAERQQAHQKVEAAGLTLLGGGVIYMNNNPDEIRSLFEYAKDAGMPTLVSSPEPDALDTVEKLAREYDLRVAIHNHGPGDKRYPSPLDVLRLVKSRDPRLGICMDVGHTVRIGVDPVEAIQQCAARLYDFHMKDVTQATAKGGATNVGRGVIDIVGVLRALISVKFAYHVALEYEAHGDAPMPGMIESFAYLRGTLAAID